VQAAFAPHFMLEVFDRIGDEHIVTVDPRLFEGAVEDTAGRPHEGPAGFIFLVAGLFAVKHHRRRLPLFAGNDLRCELIERAARAASFRLAKRREGLGDDGAAVSIRAPESQPPGSLLGAVMRRRGSRRLPQAW
jgi:hypothetical protein